jgi:hypothetical protein
MSNIHRNPNENVVLRPATADDVGRLRALAERDSATAPAGPLLLAEVGGELRAAWSGSERRAIADPFHPTAHLIELLQAHAEQAEWRRHPRRLAGLLRSAPRPV